MYVRLLDGETTTDNIINIKTDVYLNVNDLRINIQTQLNTVFGANTFEVEYNENTMRFQINTTKDKVKIFTDKEIYYSTDWDGPNFDHNNLQSANGIITNVTPQYAQNILTGIVDLRRYHNIYISSSNLSSFTTLGPLGQNNIIKKVPITSDYGSVIYDNVVANHDWFNVSKLLLKTLEFRLSDAYGNTIDLKGTSISFSLIFMIEQD